MAGPIDFRWEDILPDSNLPGDVIVSILSKLSVESLLKLKGVSKAWRSMISSPCFREVNLNRQSLVSNILCNLPVKSLLKFKAVSKTWRSLICSPGFREIHLHRQSIISNNLLISFGDEECGFGVVAANNNHDKDNTSADSDVSILDSSILFELSSDDEDEVSDGLVSGNYIWILGSCNGLVCLADSGILILWNPATRKSRSLKLPNKGGYHLSLMTVGLCYVDDDFKIVGWNDSSRSGRIKKPSLFVYSLSSDSWKRVDYDAKKAPVTAPTFMSGFMHWLMYTGGSKYVMVAFNVQDGGVISCFGVPDDCGRHSKSVKRVLVINGCLSIVILYDYEEETESKFEVWVMEEYGVEASWVKRFTFQWLTPHFIIPMIPWNDLEIVFKCRGNGDPAIRSILTFYDPFSKMKYCLEFKSFEIGQVFEYVESLAYVEAAEPGKALF